MRLTLLAVVLTLIVSGCGSQENSGTENSAVRDGTATQPETDFDARFRATQKRLKAAFFGQLRIDDSADDGLQLSLFPREITPFSLPYRGHAPKEGCLLKRPSRHLTARNLRIADSIKMSGVNERLKDT